MSLVSQSNGLRQEHACRLQWLWEGLGSIVQEAQLPGLSKGPECPWGSIPQYPPIFPQVTLSYGVFEGKLNVIKLPGPFSHEEDPSRWVWGRDCRMRAGTEELGGKAGPQVMVAEHTGWEQGEWA